MLDHWCHCWAVLSCLATVDALVLNNPNFQPLLCPSGGLLYSVTSAFLPCENGACNWRQQGVAFLWVKFDFTFYYALDLGYNCRYFRPCLVQPMAYLVACYHGALWEGLKKAKWKFKMAFAIRRPPPPPPLMAQISRHFFTPLFFFCN